MTCGSGRAELFSWDITPPDVVIANDLPEAGAGEFVHPDAFVLRDFVWQVHVDRPVPTTPAIWSYAGTGRYLLNGIAPLDPATEDPNAPGEKEIGGDGLDLDPAQQDDNVCFFATHHRSNTTIPNGRALRLGCQVLATPNIRAGGRVENNGGVVLTRYRIDRMRVPAN